MMKGYEAIYNDGRVEWVGESPRLSHARVLVIVEDSAAEPSSINKQPISNGDLLANCIESWDGESRRALAERFGHADEWQRAQREARQLPGRNSL